MFANDHEHAFTKQTMPCTFIERAENRNRTETCPEYRILSERFASNTIQSQPFPRMTDRSGVQASLIKPLVSQSGSVGSSSSNNAFGRQASGETAPDLPRTVPGPPSTKPPAVNDENNFKTLLAVSSPAASRNVSRANSELSDELPNNVSKREQLSLLPEECLSQDDERPLRHVDEMDHVTKYALSPMLYSVIYILLVELLERFAFYGINYTQTSFLTGAYDEYWSANMQAVSASTYVSVSVAVAYTTPFLGAYLGDALLGDYWSILVGITFFYLPGLLLIALTTIPGLLGPEFNKRALGLGLLCLWPVGTGIVKSCVNVFGARQHHPLLQSSLIEAYYVKFYMCINIGALIGGVAVPVLAQYDVTLAYFLPVMMLTLGLSLFMMGSSRYVKSHPAGKRYGRRPKILESSESNGMMTIFKISLLVIPFNIAYSQMATTFIVQGTVMKRAFGIVDAACMNNADAIAVLLFGYIVGSKIYPALAKRGIKIPTTHKFALGSFLGALAIAWALYLELLIHRKFEEDGGRISILWQSLSYVLIGAGEIFAVSAAYEVAFTASPPEKKVQASAVNLFCIGGLPNVFCIVLYHSCASWFQSADGDTNITNISAYATADVYKYFFVLFLISMGGVVLNLLKVTREFVEGVEERATEMIKTPKTPIRPSRKERGELGGEETPLIRAKRYQAYLKYGSGPHLYKSGSMRAAPYLSAQKARKPMTKSQVGKLYRSDPVLPSVNTIVGPDGKPITAGSILAPKSSFDREAMSHGRSDSM